MDSILANIFLKVQERLNKEVPELKWIDQDYGQLEFYKDRPPVAWPCALLDLDDTDYSNAGENIQLADSGILIIRLGLVAYGETVHLASTPQKNIALQYYNLEHRVNQILHGWSDQQYFTALMRKKAFKEKRDDNLRVRVLRYEFSFTDYTAMEVPAFTVTKPDFDIK